MDVSIVIDAGDRDWLTPPEVARHWRCKPSTVLRLVKTKALDAYSLSPDDCRRPHWRIKKTAITDFENRRSAGSAPANVPSLQKPARRRTRRPADVIQFFK